MEWKIELRGLEFFARHGYYEAEQQTGNRYEVNLTLWARLEKNVMEDRLAATVNYEEVAALVSARMQRNARLLETLCGEIAASLLDKFPMLSRVQVSVAKNNPPLGVLCRQAVVSLEMQRE